MLKKFPFFPVLIQTFPAQVLSRPSDLDDALLQAQRIVLSPVASGLPAEVLFRFKGDLQNAWSEYMTGHPFLESQLQAARFLLFRRLQTYQMQTVESPLDDNADGVSLFACSDLSLEERQEEPVSHNPVMVEPTDDAISQFDDEEHSPINGSESPHHLMAKQRYMDRMVPHTQMVPDDACGVAAWDVRPLDEPVCPSGEPEVASGSDRARPRASSGGRVYDGFTRTSGEWPAPQPESSSWKPFFYPRQKKFKFGGCPECASRALTPQVITEVREWRGSVRLMCTGHFQKTVSGFRLCLVSFPYDMEAYHLLPVEIRQQYESVRMSLLRGGAGH